MTATGRGQRRRRRLLAALGVAVAVAVALGGLAAALSSKMAQADAARLPAPTSAGTSAPLPPLLLTMGDSIPGGSDFGGRECSGFPMSVARAVGWRWGCTAVGGTGYVAAVLRGTQPFARAQAATAIAAHPDVVVVVGSTNDIGVGTTAQVTAAAADLYRTLRAALPDVRIVAVGPVIADPAKLPAVTPYADAVRQATVETGVTFIDPNAEGWLTAAPRAMIGPDGLHPTQEGHLRIAQLLGADLARQGLLPAPAVTG